MNTSVVTSKGQVVIPARLRKKTGIKAGIRVFVEEREGDIIIHPATPNFYEKTFGILKGGSLLKTLRKSRQEEKKREEKLVSWQGVR